MDDLIAEFNSIVKRWKEVSIDDPKKGLALADEAVKIAQRLGNLFMARALAVRGSALRSIGAQNESEEVLMSTLANLDVRDLAERTDILRRIAYLRAEQRRFDAALAVIEEAIATCKSLPKHEQGKVFLAKAYIHGEMNEYHEAIPYLIESLLLIDPELCTVSHDVAIHNLIIAISLDETLNFTTLKDLLAGLDRAGRSLSRKSPIFRLKRKWAGALIDLRLGMNNKAFSTLLGVRRELKRLRRSSVELAMVSIDMAQACIELGSFDRACEMLEKALKLLTEIEGVNPCAVASLGACLEALRANQFEIENLQVARRALLGSNTDNTDVRRECNMPMQYLSD